MAMSDEHKAALAEGRVQARAIKGYLAALGSRRPGRPITRESLTGRLDRLAERIATEDDPLARVELIQQRQDVEDQLETLADETDFAELERGFATHAKAYSERKGISYSAWREVGVPAAVLREAGIPRTRRS